MESGNEKNALNQAFDNYEDEEDELDLIKLVSTNANDTSQYLVFVGSDNQYFAKNVSKIEELLVYKDLKIARNNDGGLIVGTADIRGNMTTIVNFDRWFGNPVLDDSEYELVIVAHYGGHRLGLIVKRVEYIVNLPSETMVDNSENNPKTSFLTNILINGKDQLCLIFDSDKLLLDVFSSIEERSVAETEIAHSQKASEKLILFADDSRFIRSMVGKMLQQMGLNYKVFHNGKELLDALDSIAVEEIGLFITDLEMPILGGRELIEKLRSNKSYNTINIIVHTNMSNDNMKTTLLQNGANEIIGKVDILKLSQAVDKFMI